MLLWTADLSEFVGSGTRLGKFKLQVCNRSDEVLSCLILNMDIFQNLHYFSAVRECWFLFFVVVVFVFLIPITCNIKLPPGSKVENFSLSLLASLAL